MDRRTALNLIAATIVGTYASCKCRPKEEQTARLAEKKVDAARIDDTMIHATREYPERPPEQTAEQGYRAADHLTELVRKLPKKGKRRRTDEWSLDTKLLDREMARYNGGVELQDLKPWHTKGDQRLARTFVPYFGSNSCHSYSAAKSHVTEIYPDIDLPCALQVTDTDELKEHMLAGYVVAHFHYILGKAHNIKGIFPDKCCGISTDNVMFSMMCLGYPQATHAYDYTHDHAYVLLPFMMGRKKGSIIIDPTYEQLWDEPKQNIAAIMKEGETWEYKTDWKEGADLYPEQIYSLDTYTRKGPIHPTRDFFRKAFENPIPTKL